MLAVTLRSKSIHSGLSPASAENSKKKKTSLRARIKYMWSVYHRNFGNELLSFKGQTLSNSTVLSATVLSARNDVKPNIFPFSLPTWPKSKNYNALSASKGDFIKNRKSVGCNVQFIHRFLQLEDSISGD